MRTVLLVSALLLLVYTCSAQSYSCNFDQYIARFDKNYAPGSSEYQTHQSIFLQNCSAVNLHNSDSSQTYTMTINYYTDLNQDDSISTFDFIQPPADSISRKTLILSREPEPADSDQAPFLLLSITRHKAKSRRYRIRDHVDPVCISQQLECTNLYFCSKTTIMEYQNKLTSSALITIPNSSEPTTAMAATQTTVSTWWLRQEVSLGVNTHTKPITILQANHKPQEFAQIKPE